MDKKRIYEYVKRALDVFFSVILLALLSIPMLIIAMLVTITSDGSVIFKQERVGADGRIFVCYKFRTMYKDTPADRPTNEFFDAESYITSIGRFLRKTSLDELPQLYNVLLGDMSLVGPRPLIPCETKAHELRKRCGVYRVRPGITGLAQIRGRDLLGTVDKVRYDVRYVSRLSFKEDIRIIGSTALQVAKRKDVTY